MAYSPVVGARPSLYLELLGVPGTPTSNVGYFYTSFEFKAMVNGGYTIKAILYDSHFNLLDDFMRKGYFKKARKTPIVMKFSISYRERVLEGEVGREAVDSTRSQYAILTTIRAYNEGHDKSNIELIGIDPPTYFLNSGDSNGGVFKGNISSVIMQCIDKYYPESVTVENEKRKIEITHTRDSKYNKWWMMRQDPRTFISSLLDWSSALTPKKTQWLVSSDGYDLSIKEQADIKSVPRAYYRSYADSDNASLIKGYELISDNAFSITHAGMTTQGSSTVTGAYFDQSTSPTTTVVRDGTTRNKQIAEVKGDRSFTKPDETFKEGSSGSTSIISIPEIYSAGELGIPYGDYIDGRARGLYLNLTQSLIRIKLEIQGHAIWRSCKGLGVDTVYIRWVKGASKSKYKKGTADVLGNAQAIAEDNSDAGLHHWVTGNWIVYGFNHRVERGGWLTDLYLCRYDQNASANKVGGMPINSNTDRD